MSQPLYHFNLEWINSVGALVKRCEIRDIRTTQTAHEYICSYFNLQHPSDKKLIESIFHTYYPWPVFELTSTTDVTYKIKFIGTRESLPIKQKYPPLKGDVDMSIQIKNDVGRYRRGLNEIEKYKTADPTLTALFYSHSFIRLKERSDDLQFSRTIDKIKLNKSCKL